MPTYLLRKVSAQEMKRKYYTYTILFYGRIFSSIEFDKKWKNDDRKWIQKAEIGFLFEDLVSRDLVKFKGNDFTRKYKLHNLSGLARLALPPKIHFISHSNARSSRSWVQSW